MVGGVTWERLRPLAKSSEEISRKSTQATPQACDERCNDAVQPRAGLPQALLGRRAGGQQQQQQQACRPPGSAAGDDAHQGGSSGCVWHEGWNDADLHQGGAGPGGHRHRAGGGQHRHTGGPALASRGVSRTVQALGALQPRRSFWRSHSSRWGRAAGRRSPPRRTHPTFCCLLERR